MKRYVFSVLVIAVLTCLAGAQQASAPSNSVGQTSTTQGAAVPTLVRYYGVAKDLNGNPLTDVVGATFALYTEETGGAALWIETQNVYPDATGHYSVQLGATRAEGLPLDLFVSGEARWLGIQISGQAEQPRVLLLSVPYALKAGDAATIGGLPPSAFMLANPANTPSSATQLKNPFTSKSASTPGSSTVTTSGGTVDAIPLFSTSTDIENSILSQRVTSNSSVINVNGSRSAPGWLQVQGEVQIGTHSSNNVNWGVIELESKPALQACCNFGNFFVGGAGNFNQINGTKNIGLGYDALINLNGISATQNTALGYSSLYATTTGSSNTAVGAYSGVAGIGITTGSQNTFVGYSASSGSATLNNATAVGSNAFVSESNALVLGSIAGLNGATNNTNVGIGTSVPAYTLDVEAPSGFNPTVNFGNSTQTANFTMNGTANITGSLYVNGQQVTGGGGNGGSGTVTSVGLTAPSTDFLVTGSPITASGTLGLAWLVPPTSTDTPNAIVKRDTSGNISAATVNADTQFNLGGTMFDSGSSASNDAFLGFAGNGTNPGVGNVAAGWQALSADTSGGSNVAAGYKALNNDTTGSFNVAVGNFAGQSGDGSPMTGNNNTFVGGGAEASYGSNGSGPLTNATAVGSNAVVGESNALVLGSVCCLNNATSNTKVGIGTTTPGATLDVEAPAGTGAPTVNIGNSANNAVVNVTGTLNLNGQSIGSGSGISTINTPLGSGLAGGGNSSTLNLSLASAGCTAGQVMSWTGSLWACSTVSGGGGGSGTVTSVAGGTGIVTTPSPITGAGTVAIDPTVVPQLGAANNNFTGNENVTGSISVVPNAYMNAMTASGFSAAYGSQGGGSNAIQAFGGTGDSSSTTPGGMGIFSEGGGGGVSDGDGGSFVGGYGASSSGFGDGIHAVAGSGYAGNFYGDLNVTGAITAGTKDFKIDHPLDPANKYLVHASVESSEMMNIYTGNVVTDAEGNASVDLPEWFEALNTDFRYQLTVIGQFAQAIVANEVANNRFSIRTDKPNVKVSWQITAIRHDAFAKAHPLVVEQEKEARLKGYYIHPELHGAPAEKQIEWARHPELMQRIKQSHVRKTTAKANPRNSSNAFR